MCGIVSIYGKEGTNIVRDLYDSLISLQHRGQDACGIVTYNERFHLKKGLGLVQNVFDKWNMLSLKGNLGIGHVRYATIGDGTKEEAQPFIVNVPYGIAMAHNGNITNFLEIKKELAQKDLRHINSNSDADVILNVFASELAKQKNGSFPQKVFKTVDRVHQRLRGSYSVVGIIADKGILAFRDPYGIKPLVWGKKRNEYIFASEDIMLNMLGFKHLGDVQPGECIFIDKRRRVYRKTILKKEHCPCMFEYVYFARPDAVLDNISVYKARLRMGNKLSFRLLPLLKKLKIDVIVPAPTTANPAALTLAYDLGVKYREGLIKNQFIGRTFIMPNQEMRQSSLRYKFSPVELEIRGKNVLLLDDSIVRGNTSKGIVKLLKEFGAKKVYFAVYSPPLKYPCVYGIDMPTREELIAHKLSVEEIRKKIGANFLIYQDLKDLIKAVQEGNPSIKNFCTACFSGKYPTKISKKQLIKLEKERIKDRKNKNKSR